MGGRFHPRLNINTRPIENKYREGKVKRTLKRGLKVPEIVKGEADAAVDLTLCELFICVRLWDLLDRFIPPAGFEGGCVWCIHMKQGDINFKPQTMTVNFGLAYGLFYIGC
jgi:hypothetical protein